MSPPPKAKVLIVEDDAGVLELLRIRLELAGYGTFYARDGYEALSVASRVEPDAIILDIGLPKLDGFGVLKELRTNRKLRRVPVLMLTARHLEADVQKSLALGAQDYVSKPFDDKVLLQRLMRLLGGKKPQPETAHYL